MKYKTNTVKCDIGSYIHYWRGIKKSGKTTLFYELVKKQYGDLNKGLLIAIGNEIGYQALDGLVYAETPTWEELMEVVDDLVENKEGNEFEIIGLDTADELIKLAKQEVIRLHKKKTGNTVEFNAALGGYGAPRDKVNELVDDVLAKLRSAGYGLVIIGHTKVKDIKEKNGDAYQKLGSNLNEDFDNIFANKADIIMVIYSEKEIDEQKHISDVQRYMYFRTDGFVDAGGRFKNIPARVPYGADEYISAFEQAVKGAIDGKISDKEIESRKKAEKDERETNAKKYAANVKADKASAELEANRQSYLDVISANFSSADADIKTKAKELLANAGAKKFTDPDLDIEVLKTISELFG